MALAAAYASGDKVGHAMVLAVLLHEVPHEVGDFAVLLSLGYSKQKAFVSVLFYSEFLLHIDLSINI